MARSGLGMRKWCGVSAVRKSKPASSSSTRTAGSSLSRAARTAPAEPPPMMTKSYSFSMAATCRPRPLPATLIGGRGDAPSSVREGLQSVNELPGAVGLGEKASTLRQVVVAHHDVARRQEHFDRRPAVAHDDSKML